MSSRPQSSATPATGMNRAARRAHFAGKPSNN